MAESGRPSPDLTPDQRFVLGIIYVKDLGGETELKDLCCLLINKFLAGEDFDFHKAVDELVFRTKNRPDHKEKTQKHFGEFNLGDN